MTAIDVEPAEPDFEWRGILSAIRDGGEPIKPSDGPLAAIFAPLVAAHRSGLPFLVAQIGQSLDGRIATVTGESQSINGDAGIAHHHRLRALVDAVVIGIDTAI